MAKKVRPKKARKKSWQGEIYVDGEGLGWIVRVLKTGSAIPYCVGPANELTERQKASFGWYGEL